MPARSLTAPSVHSHNPHAHTYTYRAGERSAGHHHNGRGAGRVGWITARGALLDMETRSVICAIIMIGHLHGPVAAWSFVRSIPSWVPLVVGQIFNHGVSIINGKEREKTILTCDSFSEGRMSKVRSLGTNSNDVSQYQFQVLT